MSTHPPARRRVEIIIVLLTVLALGAYSIPRFLRARAGGMGEACRQNIAKIESAIDEYQLAGDDSLPYPFSMDELYGAGKVREPEALPVCPLGGTYSLRPNGQVVCDHGVGK